MAQVTTNTALHITQVNSVLSGGAEEWSKAYGIGSEVPASGIYRCTGCGDEITSNKGTKFPPQNHHQHKDQKVDVLWQLIVKTQTKA
ncbi:protein L [Pseudomonas capsici]|uniref:protein L n=1 Tax=Pseudomonas capsici TaxID=2810614 RepID=UPI0021F200BA|nr:protein L [Pseudomonas capsici]MCV4343228.1 protein L [Pseudomonas capsici]